MKVIDITTGSLFKFSVTAKVKYLAPAVSCNPISRQLDYSILFDVDGIRDPYPGENRHENDNLTMSISTTTHNVTERGWSGPRALISGFLMRNGTHLTRMSADNIEITMAPHLPGETSICCLQNMAYQWKYGAGKDAVRLIPTESSTNS